MVDIISIHIPKTAGTLFFDVLKNVYSEEKVFRDYSGKNPFKPKELDKVAHEFQVIHGHFRAKRYENHFPTAKRITWLRHPLFRFISFYYFWMNLPCDENAAPLHKYAQQNNLSLLELAEHPVMKYDMMSSFVEGRALEDYSFIGIQEFFLEDLLELGEQLNWPQKILQHIGQLAPNTNPEPHYLKYVNEVLSDRFLVSRLTDILEADYELYQSALEMRANRRSESKFMQQTLADWERSKFYLSQHQKSNSVVQSFKGLAQKIRQTLFNSVGPG